MGLAAVLVCVPLLLVAVCAAALVSARSSSHPANRLGDNPLARYRIPWTREIRWSSVVSIEDFPNGSLEARFEAAQTAVASQGGGVVFFPAGVYRFSESLALKDGVVIRGANPQGITDARQEGYAPPTRFEFPRFVPRLEGNGTPLDTAFKGIRLAEPEKAGNCGIVNVAINRGHIDFPTGEEHKAGRNRFVVGCVLRNAARANPDIPNAEAGQHPWQRYTHGHKAAISVYARENLLIANNRLPASGDDNFLQPGYVLRGRKGEKILWEEGILFDYDNRPGISANSYCIGGSGGSGSDGTPQTHPWGFRRGIVIHSNYVFCTGRNAIAFSGDGVWCAYNVVRFREGVVRPTNTGVGLTSGSSTNDNRAVQMRGWRWTVEGNDYEVYRNLSADRKTYINDGEGLMHEDHCNSTIKDSKVINNRGNRYLSIWYIGGIDGLLVQGNTIASDGRDPALNIAADRHGKRFPCRNVRIIGNTTSGHGILITGAPAENNLIVNNRHIGKNGRLTNKAEARLENNVGYTTETPK